MMTDVLLFWIIAAFMAGVLVAYLVHRAGRK